MNFDHLTPPRIAVAAMLLALPALLFSSTPAAAQGGGQQGSQGQQEARQIRQQLQQINKQLQEVRRQAMQDSALEAERLELQEIIGQAARADDPEYEEKENRLNEIQKELQAAQQNQDTAKLRSLMKEGRQLQREVQTTTREIAQRDSIQTKIEAYEKKVRQKMIELDPKAEELLDRQDSLMEELRAASGAGQPGGGEQGGGSGGGR